MLILIPTHLPNIKVCPYDVPLLAGFVPTSRDDGRVADAPRPLRWLDDWRSFVQGLEREGVIAITEMEIDEGIGSEEEHPQVPGQVWVGTPSHLTAVPLDVNGKSKDKTCPRRKKSHEGEERPGSRPCHPVSVGRARVCPRRAS